MPSPDEQVPAWRLRPGRAGVPRLRRAPRAIPVRAHRGARGQGRGAAVRTRGDEGRTARGRPGPGGRRPAQALQPRPNPNSPPLAATPEEATGSDTAAVVAPATDTGGGSNANAFNPAISIILNGSYSHHSLDPAAYARSGFPLVGGAGPSPDGFSLGESEVSFAANIDDKFYGQLTLDRGERGRPGPRRRRGSLSSTPPSLPDDLSLRARPFLFEHRLSQQPPRAHRQLLRPAAAVPGVPRQPVRRRRRAAALGRADVDVPRGRRRSCSAGELSPAAARSTAASARARCSRTPGGDVGTRTRGSPACRC